MDAWISWPENNRDQRRPSWKQRVTKVFSMMTAQMNASNCVVRTTRPAIKKWWKTKYVSCESCFWIPGNSERSNDLTTNSWQSTIPCTLHVPCLDAKMASSIGPANLQLCEMRASFLSYLSSALLSPSEVNGEKDQKGPTRIKDDQSISKPNMHTWSYMVNCKGN